MRRNTAKWKPRLRTVIFLAVWTLVWFPFSISDLISVSREHRDLLSAYQTGNYAIAEGRVKVLRTQPKSGHAPGDLVSVGGRQFEINFFLQTPAYHTTIAWGGRLREGVYAKVFYHDGEILRIDVRRDPDQPSGARDD